MALSPGSRIGAFEITGPLGAGGMGEVYRATDTNLGRQVAIKILPPEFAADAERVARFEREARTLASLNHPNIAQVYGLEHLEREASAERSAKALVMELVEGEDLSDRIRSGTGDRERGTGIPLDEALPIARQIAEALEAAHEAGIIHRDLKPANIKVRADGTVKVLDFGLAKALKPGTGNGEPGTATMSPTITTPAMTMRGVILGTAAYMSPEQAKGKLVDKRTDIWAFGCVLYEMLTGRRAFKGDDVTDTITAVLRDEPDVTALPSDTPPHIRALIRRCLVKDPKQRLRDIGEARLTLLEPGNQPATSTPAERPPARASVALWLAAIVVIGALSFAAARLTLPASPPPPEMRFEIPTANALSPAHIAISPDGRRLAFIQEGQLWIRDLAAVEARALPGTLGATNPAWSPGGQWIAYTAAPSRLMRVRVDASAPETLHEQAIGRPAWLSESELVFTHAGKSRLHRMPAAGGTSQPVFTEDGNAADRQTYPAVLPGTDHVLFLSRPPGDSRLELRLGSVAAGSSRPLFPSDSMGVFAGPNTLLFVRNNTLFAQPFDPDRLELAGDPIRVSDDVAFNSTNGRGGFDASVNGTVVLRRRTQEDASSRWNLRELSRTGELVKAFEGSAQPLGPALSPDGARLAFHQLAENGGDVWMLDRQENVQRRFTFDPAQENASPVWSPDGGRIVFRSRRGTSWALVEKPANGAGAEVVLAEFPQPVSPMSWSADGTHLLFMLIDPATNWDIWQYSFADRRASPVLNTSANEGFAQFAPDARSFAYSVHSASGVQIFVESFPPGRGKWQVPTTERSEYPRWRGDGRELFFVRQPVEQNGPYTAMAVDVRTSGGGIEFGPPRRLFDARGIFVGVSGYSGNYMAWAVSGDGQRFFLQQPLGGGGGTGTPPLVVIMNHPALLPRQ